MEAKLVIARMLHTLRASRRAMLAVLAVTLLVQTALPAHEDSHPLGPQQNLHCEYCVMAGHAVGVPSVAIQMPAPPVYTDLQAVKPADVLVPPLPRTVFSRGPPSISLA